MTYKKLQYICISKNYNLNFNNLILKDKVDWDCISEYQKLSEDFIREFQDKVVWGYISEYQKLSEDFIREFKLIILDDNWLYKNKSYKLAYIKKHTTYKIIDNEYIIAYKSIRNDEYSIYNFQYKYEVGETYTSHCDCTNNENSFGLSAWTKTQALEYYHTGLLLEVKIYIDDIGRIVHNNNKIRCFKLKILNKI